MITTEQYVEMLELHGAELVDWPDVALVTSMEQALIISAAPVLEYSAAAERAASLWISGRAEFAVAAALCQDWQYRRAGRACR